MYGEEKQTLQISILRNDECLCASVCVLRANEYRSRLEDGQAVARVKEHFDSP